MDDPAPVPAFVPRRSTHLLLLLTATHTGAMIATVVAVLPVHVTVLILLCLLMSWCVVVRRWYSGHWCGTGVIRIGSDGVWHEEPASGPVRRWQPVSPSYVHPLLVVVRLRALDAPLPDRDLVLLPDSLPADAARRLRTWLRLHHGGE